MTAGRWLVDGTGGNLGEGSEEAKESQQLTPRFARFSIILRCVRRAIGDWRSASRRRLVHFGAGSSPVRVPSAASYTPACDRFVVGATVVNINRKRSSV